jgi:hypothetical protein
MTNVTITRDEITELRYLKDGILVRGKDLRQTLQLMPELDGFEDLVKQIEEWTPTQVPRIRSSISMGIWVMTLLVMNIGLMILAMSTKNHLVAIPASVAVVSVLVACVIWVWRSNGIARRLKWSMLMTLIPAISLLYRAYLLWTLR